MQRLTLILCLVLMILALPDMRAMALVTNDPLDITILQPPGDLQKGQTHLMTLRLEAFGPVYVTDPVITGAGWTVKQLDWIGLRDMFKGEVVELRFELTPDDPDQPITIDLTTNDMPRRVIFDPVNTQWKPGELVSSGDFIPRSTVPRVEKLTRPMRPTPPLSEQHPRYAELEKSGNKRFRTFRVFGQIEFGRLVEMDRIGLDGATVKVMDWNDSFELELASTTTDDAGYYQVDFNWYDLPQDYDPDIFLRLEMANNLTLVKPDGIAEVYSWETAVHYNVTADLVDMGRHVVVYEAWNILIGITRSARFLSTHSGITLPLIIANFPWGDGVSRFDRATEQLFFSSEHPFREWVHGHEYGHFFSWRTNGLPMGPWPPGGMYCNPGGFCDPPGENCGHCNWCQETDEVAWSEGFSNYIGDAMTREWADGLYDDAPVGMFGNRGEYSDECHENSVYHDPYQTEGFTALLLHDIDDDNEDDDPIAPGLVDPLDLGFDEIFTIYLDDMPGDLTIHHFIQRFLYRYPEHAPEFWETATNAGFTGLDNVNPVTLPPISSHAVGVPSADNSITMFWPPGTDEMSGLAGYSYEFSPDTPVVPSVHQWAIAGNVWAKDFPSLAPGTYFFTLRAFDREGNFDPEHETYGPMIVLQPEPADLGPFTASGWAYPVVPRSSNDATDTYAPAPTSLLYNSTYWNVGIQNHGDATTQSNCYTAVRIDGEVVDDVVRGNFAGGANDRWTNEGPLVVQGGRHTFTADIDYFHLIPELDEEDNRFGRQWVWNPTVFYPALELNRPAPPWRSGGWEDAGGGNYFNCDGLFLLTDTPSDMVAAVYILPDNLYDDFDIRLHDYETDATSGYRSNLGFSARPARYLDAVLVNVTNRPAPGYEAGVITSQETSNDGYWAKLLYSDDLPLGSIQSNTFPAGEAMMLYKFGITEENQGPMTVDLQMDLSVFHSDVYLAWYDETFATGTLLSYDQVVEEDPEGDALMHIDGLPGLHTLVLWREPGFGLMLNRSLTLELRDRWPDMATYTPPGWDAPFVPRTAPDALVNWAPLPASLPGDGDTYLNFSFINLSPGEGGAFTVGTFFDGALFGVAGQSNTGGGAPRLYGNSGPWLFPGGRHTLVLNIDYLGELDEDDLTNNVFGTQHVWEPAVLAMDVPVSRSEPEAATAGWADITVPQAVYYNADGMRTPLYVPGGEEQFWGAVAVMPGGTSEIDLRLHLPSTGIADGLDHWLTRSSWPPGESDFVLANFNVTDERQFDAGMINGAPPTGEHYTVMATASQFLGNEPNGIFGTYPLGPNDIIGLHEFHAFAGDHYIVELDPQIGACDLGISLYGPDLPYLNKSNVFLDEVNGPVMAYAAGPEEEELIDFQIEVGGYYCLVVWKRGIADLPQEEEYALVIQRTHISAVGDEGGLPTVTKMVGAYPNPFNPQTMIVMDLAAAENVRVEVFDVRGRLVRTLAEQVMAPGRHEIPWNGMDDSGRRVASGNYLLRMQAGVHQGVTRVSLVK